jgi:hypothetical protein
LNKSKQEAVSKWGKYKIAITRLSLSLCVVTTSIFAQEYGVNPNQKEHTSFKTITKYKKNIARQYQNKKAYAIWFISNYKI